MNRLVVSSLLVAALSAGAAIAAPAPAPQGDPARGKVAFLRVGCYTCHGYEGQGVPGKKIAPNPMAYAAFAAYVRTSPGEMPTFTPAVLPDQELVDIYA